MPTLDWMGKDKVVNHHRDVPFRVLKRTPEKGILDDAGSDRGNMVIHGDNLEALKSLLPEYEGQVDVVYIDPPYNTGNEDWVYNDNVNDPRIRRWLGQVVGKEGEDFTRHDKWLCMMYPRLVLLRKLIAPTGTIFISADDNEEAPLRLVCDEIFGRSCFVANIGWQRNYSTRNDSKGIPAEAEHILVYGKQPGWQPRKLERTAKMDAKYRIRTETLRRGEVITPMLQGLLHIKAWSMRFSIPLPGNCFTRRTGGVGHLDKTRCLNI